MGFLTALNMYPTLAAIVNPLLSRVAKGHMRLHGEMVKPMVEDRIRIGDRPDLINPLIKLYDGQVSPIARSLLPVALLLTWGRRVRT
jgi:hypothetical protein